MTGEALATRVGGRLDGESREIDRLLPPGAAEPGGVVVASDEEALAVALAADGSASLGALVVGEDAVVPEPHPPLLRHADPRLAFARISGLLSEEPAPPAGVDPRASVDAGARLAADVAVGPFATVAAGAVVEGGCVIDAGAVVGADCRIGGGSRLFPRTVLYPGVRIGAGCRVHAGAVLGADGFGYAPGRAGAEKIHHLGSVVLGDDVEIGAGTCIDRGTLGDTTVGSGTKIDNLCQVGHNVRIGRDCLVAGMAAIGGSSVLEDGVVLGGGVALTDHVTIHAGARIAGRAGVSKDVPAGAVWGGLPAMPMRSWVRERYLIGRLERIWSFVRAAERRS